MVLSFPPLPLLLQRCDYCFFWTGTLGPFLQQGSLLFQAGAEHCVRFFHSFLHLFNPGLCFSSSAGQVGHVTTPSADRNSSVVSVFNAVSFSCCFQWAVIILHVANVPWAPCIMDAQCVTLFRSQKILMILCIEFLSVCEEKGIHGHGLRIWY